MAEPFVFHFRVERNLKLFGCFFSFRINVRVLLLLAGLQCKIKFIYRKKGEEKLRRKIQRSVQVIENTVGLRISSLSTDKTLQIPKRVLSRALNDKSNK